MEPTEPHLPIDTSDIVHQSELYKTYILPQEDDFLSCMTDIRSHVDELLLSVQAEHWHENPFVTREDAEMGDVSNLFLYPDKNCFLIVKFFRMIFDEVLREGNYGYIEQFLQNGGIFQRSWGGYQASNGSDYLQNFFQVGDRVLDVAYEEMEQERNISVHITPIQVGKYINFHTLESYKSAVESYYQDYSIYSMIGILGKYAFFHPFLSRHITSGYIMHTPTDFPFHPSEICAFLTQEKQDQIPELVREELISIVSTILAFETYTELEGFFLQYIHNVLLGELREPGREVFESMEQRVQSIAQEEGISYEQCYGEHASDIAGVLARIYDMQYDRNYFRRTGKVFVPTRT